MGSIVKTNFRIESNKRNLSTFRKTWKEILGECEVLRTKNLDTRQKKIIALLMWIIVEHRKAEYTDIAVIGQRDIAFCIGETDFTAVRPDISRLEECGLIETIKYTGEKMANGYKVNWERLDDEVPRALSAVEKRRLSIARRMEEKASQEVSVQIKENSDKVEIDCSTEIEIKPSEMGMATENPIHSYKSEEEINEQKSVTRAEMLFDDFTQKIYQYRDNQELTDYFVDTFNVLSEKVDTGELEIASLKTSFEGIINCKSPDYTMAALFKCFISLLEFNSTVEDRYRISSRHLNTYIRNAV